MLERDVQQTSEIVSQHSYNWFGCRPKKADGLINAEIVGIAEWKKIAASWILRIGRCLKATDPGLLFIFVICVVIGFMTGMVSVMPLGYHDPTPSFLWIIGHCLYRIIECLLSGWTLLYGCWEFVQGWKWLSNWSERIKQEEARNAPPRR